MADLVSESEFVKRVGGEPDPDVVAAVLDEAEAMFEAACGRQDCPFAGVLTDRTEIRDGNGCSTLYTQYPIGSITSITLGFDPLTPDETLDVDDPAVLLFTVGKRRLTRRGGVFGCFGAPQYIQIVYTTQADLPVDAAAAVLRAAAMIYEAAPIGALSERLGAYSIDTASSISKSLLAQDPTWQSAVESNRAVLV